MRKGDYARYIGADELMIGKTFKIRKKTGNHIVIGKPIKYLDGSVHDVECAVPIEDFEKVERRFLW